MAQDTEYQEVVVESFSLVSSDRSGHHGEVHIRPLPGQKCGTHLFVECSKRLMDPSICPVGAKFKIRAKLTDRQGGTKFLYSYHGWKVEVLSDEEAAAFIERNAKRSNG
jgi:hypothetical protein